MKQPETIRIFVGASQDQQIPFKCLKYSIEQHTQNPVEMRCVSNQDAGNLNDPLNATATGFSYGRLTLPKLTGYQGKAIYLDSDMIVYDDIAKLWNTPFNGAKVLSVKPNEFYIDIARPAVLLMDCSRLDWDPNNMRKSLIKKKILRKKAKEVRKYNRLTTLLTPEEYQGGITSGWNDLDHKNDNTKLLHFTNMSTQPWVYAKHPHNDEWISILKILLDNGMVRNEEVMDTIQHKYFRPSLAHELGFYGENQLITRDDLHEIDVRENFKPYAFLQDKQNQARQQRLVELKASLPKLKWYMIQSQEIYRKARKYWRRK